jgi:hypothetical protein
MNKRIAAIAFVICLGLVSAAPAFAGVGASVVPTFPTPMNVGDIKTATITMTNHATAANNTENVNVSGIFFTPSCASSDGFTCFTPDPGVFQFATAIGKVGSSCASTVFTLAPPDPGTGEIALIPPVSKPVVLGPANAAGPLPKQCVITINYKVLKAPQDSTPPNPPITTDSLVRASIQGASSGSGASASGGSTTPITVPTLPIVDLSITTTNGVVSVSTSVH